MNTRYQASNRPEPLDSPTLHPQRLGLSGSILQLSAEIYRSERGFQFGRVLATNRSGYLSIVGDHFLCETQPVC